MDEHDERRTTFRIDDHIYLDWQRLEGAEASGWRHDISGFCDGLMRLREVTVQSNHILAGIRKQHSEIGHYLALLDKKVDILSQLVAEMELGDQVLPNHHVNIGANGFAFHHTEALAVDTLLRLKLVLFPSHLCLQLRGRVVHCEVANDLHEEGAYRLGIEFEAISEAEHEALIRHLLERQSATLRQRRDQQT